MAATRHAFLIMVGLTAGLDTGCGPTDGPASESPVNRVEPYNGSGSTNPPGDSPLRPQRPVHEDELLFELDVDARFDPDDGRPLGTLFEAHDIDGQLLLSAYFSDGHSLQSRMNHHVLNFSAREANAREAPFESLGKPFDGSQTAANLFVADEDLMVYLREYDTMPLARLDRTTNAWTPDDRFGVRAFAGFQKVGSQELVYSERGIELDGLMIFEPRGLYFDYQYYYANGTFVITRTGRAAEGDVWFCAWSPSSGRIDTDACPRFPIDRGDYPLTSAVFGDDILLAMNSSRRVYRYRDGQLETVFRGDEGTSWQGYGFLRYYDALLLGQYPAGALYQYDGVSLSPFEPALPLPQGASDSAREVQVLALYNGDVYAGVWPWGEIWRHSPQGWSYVGRPFTRSSISSLEAPYMDACIDLGISPANKWGQRIMSLVPFGSSLYISTMNKQGIPFDPTSDSFLADAEDEYGAVFRMTSPASLASQIVWPGELRSHFRFQIFGGRMVVEQDGQILAESRGDFAYVADRVGVIRLGDGVAGPIAGVATR